ncbi:MAG: hypothetical protein ACFFDF_03770 [Candidatus Odinarchaeota archaeon]
MSINDWKIQKENTKEEDKHYVYWKNGKTFCCLCDNEIEEVFVGEIFVFDESYSYTVQICEECIEKLYTLFKEQTK